MYIYTAMVEELKNTLEGYLPVGLYIDYQTFIKKLKGKCDYRGRQTGMSPSYGMESMGVQ